MKSHGLSGTPEHRTWKAMWARCEAPTGRYKGLGRTPSDEWRSFTRFLADMGPKPSPKHTLERIDNSKPYGPNNCRWATYREQAQNTPHNRLLTLNGVTLPAVEWGRKLGIKATTFRSRLSLGWSLDLIIDYDLQRRFPHIWAYKPTVRYHEHMDAREQFEAQKPDVCSMFKAWRDRSEE